jgi:predicted DsbA family dithiol-disulfide isomerase
MVERFGAPGNPLDVAGEKVGIKFNRSRRFINTTNGHRVMEWCNQNSPDKSNDLMERIFHAYFEDGKDVSKTEELLAIVSTAGLDVDAVRGMLSTDALRQDVLQYDRQVKTQLRVSGVPYFIVESNTGARPTAFSGAQPADVIAEVLLEAQGDE